MRGHRGVLGKLWPLIQARDHIAATSSHGTSDSSRDNKKGRNNSISVTLAPGLSAHVAVRMRTTYEYKLSHVHQNNGVRGNDKFSGELNPT